CVAQGQFATDGGTSKAGRIAHAAGCRDRACVAQAHLATVGTRGVDPGRVGVGRGGRDVTPVDDTQLVVATDVGQYTEGVAIDSVGVHRATIGHGHVVVVRGCVHARRQSGGVAARNDV